MALQINTTLTTRQGFTVESGAYVWVHEERGADKQYKVNIRLLFFKDKAAFEQGKGRFYPEQLPDTLLNLSQTFTPANYASLTPMQVHNFLKSQLEEVLGASTVAIVQ